MRKTFKAVVERYNDVNGNPPIFIPRRVYVEKVLDAETGVQVADGAWLMETKEFQAIGDLAAGTSIQFNATQKNEKFNRPTKVVVVR